MYSKFEIKHFGELISKRDDQSATWLTASWFVGELSCYHPTVLEWMTRLCRRLYF